ncbi:fasciclin domain-containing protein [Algoriphagus sp.]|uniref:fasciclin domain-containing protein n=1 Tax=Algoriphagus sp. TaxID=1872435 RepID=UPI0025FE1F68|nr:fasciclin domain-containing protein [Algoriphagus sp.]
MCCSENYFERFITILKILLIATLFSSCVEDEKDNIIEEKSIFELISNDSQFSTLVTFLEKIEMTEMLDENGDFTLLAPTNQAFESFFISNKITFEEFLKTPELSDTILYHLLPTKVEAYDFFEKDIITQTGESIFVRFYNYESTYINGNAKLIGRNTLANNGYIHTIDYVLIPPSLTLKQLLERHSSAETPEFTYLLEALERTDLFKEIEKSGFYSLHAPTDKAFEKMFKELNINNLDEFESYLGYPLKELLLVQISFYRRNFFINFDKNIYKNMLTKNGVVNGGNEFYIPYDF